MSLADWSGLVDTPSGFALGGQLDATRPDAVLGMGERLFGISANPAIIGDLRRALQNEQRA